MFCTELSYFQMFCIAFSFLLQFCMSSVSPDVLLWALFLPVFCNELSLCTPTEPSY
jgi:hypothetical protein